MVLGMKGLRDIYILKRRDVIRHERKKRNGLLREMSGGKSKSMGLKSMI